MANDAKVRVKALGEGGLKAVDRATGIHHVLSQGDTVTVSEEAAKMWCGLGWTEDVDGSIETGERKPGARGPVIATKAKTQTKKVV